MKETPELSQIVGTQNPLLRRFALSICFPGRTRTLDSHASRLRQKLRVHSDAAWIANEWGVGYRLCRPK